MSEIREAFRHTLDKWPNIIFQWLPVYCDIARNDFAKKVARPSHVTETFQITLAGRALDEKFGTKTQAFWSSPSVSNCRLRILEPLLRLEVTATPFLLR